METSNRFAKLWEAWDTRIGAGESRQAFLVAAKDEELIELLAGESARDRRIERDVIATEILNRMRRRNTSFPTGAEATVAAAQGAQLAAEAGQAAIHASEALLHAAGEHQLGQSVSESAYESLDLTKVALEAAQVHASDVQANLAQSRVGAEAVAQRQAAAEEAADAAARAAHRGSDLTDDLEAHMAKIGGAEAGRASADAGRAIAKAADAGADAAHAEDGAEEKKGEGEGPGRRGDPN